MGGYLVCSNCNRFYKLEPGELPKDHGNYCIECGDKLKFQMNSDTEIEKYNVNEFKKFGKSLRNPSKPKINPTIPKSVYLLFGLLIIIIKVLIIIIKVLIIISLLVIAVAFFPFGTLTAIFVYYLIFYYPKHKNKL